MFSVRIYPLSRIEFQLKRVNAVNAIPLRNIEIAGAQSHFLSDFAFLARTKFVRLTIAFMRALRGTAVKLWAALSVSAAARKAAALAVRNARSGRIGSMRPR